jgi:hypothetical protein
MPLAIRTAQLQERKPGLNPLQFWLQCGVDSNGPLRLHREVLHRQIADRPVLARTDARAAGSDVNAEKRKNPKRKVGNRALVDSLGNSSTRSALTGVVPIQKVVHVTKRGECVTATSDVRVAKSGSARSAFGV